MRESKGRQKRLKERGAQKSTLRKKNILLKGQMTQVKR